MKAEDLGNSKLLNWLLKPAGRAMESGLRHRYSDPVKILEGADIRPSQTVLEVGSGTGFFTVPAARLIGGQGRLIAMEPLAGYAERLAEKARAGGLRNVDVLQRDALNTGLGAAEIDRVLLLGVLPFPTLPLGRLLPEMHRILKPDGIVAVWQFPISGWVPGSIRRSGLFTYLHKRNGVYTYQPIMRPPEDRP